MSGEEKDGEEDATQLAIPTHAFDVIITDECHCGYTAQDLAAEAITELERLWLTCARSFGSSSGKRGWRCEDFQLDDFGSRYYYLA